MRFLVQILFLLCLSLSANARQNAYFMPISVQANSIVISTSERKLYYFDAQGRSHVYSVAVGKAGKQWFGQAFIDGKYLRPDWAPPPEVKRDFPHMPNFIKGGAPNNPMGEGALTLNGGQYAIHGTNRPDSIGRAASYGCIRMHNADLLDLYARVSVGTVVQVVR